MKHTEIKYETEQQENSVGRIETICLTECYNLPTNISHYDNKPKLAFYTKVGSMACKKCIFNKGTNETNKVVQCSYTK